MSHLLNSYSLSIINYALNFQGLLGLRHSETVRGIVKPYSEAIKRLSTSGRTRNNEEDQDDLAELVEMLRMRLSHAKRISERDHDDKLKLIARMRYLHQENTQLELRVNLLSQDQPVTTIVAPVGVEIEPKQALNSSTQTTSLEVSSVAMNTTLCLADDLNQIQRQQRLDEFEGARLRENVAFWKEKVDLLLLEKKEALHEQMTLHKIIRDYEQQLEDVKLVLKDRESYMEQLQIENKQLIQTPLLIHGPNQTMLEVRTDSSGSSIEHKSTLNKAALYMQQNQKLQYKESTTSEIRQEQTLSKQYIDQLQCQEANFTDLSQQSHHIINISSHWIPPSASQHLHGQQILQNEGPDSSATPSHGTVSGNNSSENMKDTPQPIYGQIQTQYLNSVAY